MTDPSRLVSVAFAVPAEDIEERLGKHPDKADYEDPDDNIVEFVVRGIVNHGQVDVIGVELAGAKKAKPRAKKR